MARVFASALREPQAADYGYGASRARTGDLLGTILADDGRVLRWLMLTIAHFMGEIHRDFDATPTIRSPA